MMTQSRDNAWDRITEEWTGVSPASLMKEALVEAMERERRALQRKQRLALAWKAVKRWFLLPGKLRRPGK